MEPLVYVLAILGCADGGQLCEPVAQAPMTYSSMAACMAAVQLRLPEQAGLSYPVIMARCEPSGLQLVEGNATQSGG